MTLEPGEKHRRGHPERVVVVGAGLCGLTAAQALCKAGHDVIVVDKARGAGGRMSTRREGEIRFDHGAQYFTARDSRFLQQVKTWKEHGLVDEWGAKIGVIESDRIQVKAGGQGGRTTRFVGMSGMNAMCRDLASSLQDCRFDWRVNRVTKGQDGFDVFSDHGEVLHTDRVVLTTPPEQVPALLADSSIKAAAGEALATVRMRPCWAVMVVAEQPLLDGWDAAFVNQGPVSWMAGQLSKPGMPDQHAWVLHAGPGWSESNLEADPAIVGAALLEAAASLPGYQFSRIIQQKVHRWRYALAEYPLENGSIPLADNRLVLGGDWCHGSRVEGAFLSGLSAAARIA